MKNILKWMKVIGHLTDCQDRKYQRMMVTKEIYELVMINKSMLL